jgi:Septum formation
MAVEVGELRPRPGWRPGAAMRWLALQLVRSRGELRLSVWGLQGVEAFVSEAASYARPRMTGQLPDRLVLYRWSWWLLGIPGSATLAVLLLRMYLDPEGLPAGGLVLIPAALWLLWRGLGAARARPLLVLDRDGMTISRGPAFHATWDQVSSMEFLPGGQHGRNQLLVRQHATPDDRTVNLDGLSVSAQEIAGMAERLHAHHRDGTITDSSQTIGSRPSRLAAAGAIAMALIVATVGWYTRPAGEFAAGDCYRHSGAYQVWWAPCDEPHDGEILLVLEHPADDATKHPGNGALSNWTAPRCDAAFASYVGRPESADDGLTYQMWRPELQAWAEGDRTIVCVVVNETGAILDVPPGQ